MKGLEKLVNLVWLISGAFVGSQHPPGVRTCHRRHTLWWLFSRRWRHDHGCSSDVHGAGDGTEIQDWLWSKIFGHGDPRSAPKNSMVATLSLGFPKYKSGVIILTLHTWWDYCGDRVRYLWKDLNVEGSSDIRYHFWSWPTGDTCSCLTQTFPSHFRHCVGGFWQ